MEDTGTGAGAADAGAQRATDAAEKIGATEPQPKKKRARAKAEPKAETQTAQAEAVVFVVDAKDLGKTIAPFLKGIAAATKTAPPSQEEVDGISQGVAIGLRHTKFAVNPNTGPWVPLMIAATFYAVPRLVEAVTNYVNRKEEAAKVAPEDPTQLSFRELGGGTVPETGAAGATAAPTDGDGPVKAIGAKGG